MLRHLDEARHMRDLNTTKGMDDFQQVSIEHLVIEKVKVMRDELVGLELSGVLLDLCENNN